MWLVRMPRVLVGAVVGAGLALTGVALQAMVRNVLADPCVRNYRCWHGRDGHDTSRLADIMTVRTTEAM